jgi:hypothetical protein
MSIYAHLRLVICVAQLARTDALGRGAQLSARRIWKLVVREVLTPTRAVWVSVAHLPRQSALDQTGWPGRFSGGRVCTPIEGCIWRAPAPIGRRIDRWIGPPGSDDDRQAENEMTLIDLLVGHSTVTTL